MPSAKRILWLSLAFAFALAVGWFAGAAGRFQAERAQRDAEQRLHLSDARGAVLAARLSLQAQNFGEAGAALELAVSRLEQARQRFLDLRQTGPAGALDKAIALLREARQKAAALDQTAGETAVQALAEMAGVEPSIQR